MIEWIDPRYEALVRAMRAAQAETAPSRNGQPAVVRGFIFPEEGVESE